MKSLAYGGAKGGGKSVFLVRAVYAYCLWIIRHFHLKPRDKPLVVGWIGRKVAAHFTTTTLESWYEFVPSGGYRVLGKPAQIIIADTVAINTGGLDTRDAINKFNSAEFCIIGIDQAEETTESDVALLRAATHNRMSIKDEKTGKTYQMAGKAIFTCNPGQCWLKGEFIDHPKPDMPFVPALPGDNPITGPAYIESLKRLWPEGSPEYEAYVLGNWEAMDAPNQLIKGAYLSEARSKKIVYPWVKRIISCDPARFGDDECVIDVIENYDIIDQAIMHTSRATEIEHEMKKLQAEYKCPMSVESVGSDIGSGIYDHLLEEGCEVMEYRPGAGVDDKRFGNVRAAASHYASRLFIEGKIALSWKDPTMESQLCWLTYYFRGDTMFIISKEDLKKLHGGSPDRGDAYVQALWMMQFVDPIYEDEYEDYNRRPPGGDKPDSAMCM